MKEKPLALNIIENLSDILMRRSKTLKSCPVQEVLQQVSTFLTPQFKTMSHLSLFAGHSYTYSTERAIYIVYQLANVFNTSSASYMDVTVREDAHNRAITKTKSAYEEKSCRLFDAVFSDERDELSKDTKSSIQNKIKGYLANARTGIPDPLQFWRVSEKFYPHLSLVAKFVFTALSCSTLSERVFSIARLTRSQQRRDVSSENTGAAVISSYYLRERHGIGAF